MNTELLIGALKFQSMKQLPSLTQGLKLSLKLTFPDLVNQEMQKQPRLQIKFLQGNLKQLL